MALNMDELNRYFEDHVLPLCAEQWEREFQVAERMSLQYEIERKRKAEDDPAA